MIHSDKDRCKSSNGYAQIKQAVTDYLNRSGSIPPDDRQFVAFDNESKPPPRDQVQELVASVQYLLERHQGRPYENAAFIAAKADYERQKAQLLEEKQRQLAEMVKKETEKITQHYQAENEAVQRMLMEREKELIDANEETRNAAQMKINELTKLAEANMAAAERERQKREHAVQEEAQRLTNMEMRKVQTKMSEELEANERVIEELRKDLAKITSKHKKCVIS